MKRSITISVVITVLLIGGGYWFGYRPYKAKQYCHQDALKTAQSSDVYGNPNGRYDISHYNFAYSACMHNKGV